MSERGAVGVHDLHFAYPGAPAPTGTGASGRTGSTGSVLDGVGFEISAGERVALLGPNGSGKTTLALHLNGLLTAASGTVTIGGLTVDGPNLLEIRRRVGMVFQHPDDQLFMPTVAQDVAFGPANLGLDGTERRSATHRALEAVGAGGLADRSPHHLSGGEKRRAAIATVLAMDPDVLVLDEPTAGLDPAGHHELADLLAGLDQTQLIVTHDLPFALASCPRSLILDHGRIVADLATADLVDDPDLLAAHRLALPFGYRADPPR